MEKPKVLVFEAIHPVGLRYLEAQGCEIVYPESRDEAGLLKLMPEVSGILARTRGKVTRRLLEAAPHLKVIGRHGVGLDNIDVEAATEMGIWVVWTPEANSQSVAEHFVVLALMLSKKVPQTMHALRAGDWDSRNKYFGQEFHSRTVGVIGLGRIGSRIGRICHHAFACRILYNDIVQKEELEQEYGAVRVSLEQLMQEADFVSINVPLKSDTRGMIGGRELALMKPSAFIVNTARGPIWMEADLCQVLSEHRIAGAAADVFEVEPALPQNPLLQLDNFVATPHTASHTEDAMRRMAMVAEDIVTVIKGGIPRCPVNQPKRP